MDHRAGASPGGVAERPEGRKKPSDRLPRPDVPGRLIGVGPLQIPGLPGLYPLTIYLPADYGSSPDRAFPVAYFFDGQNLFHDEGSFAGGWHLHRAMDARVARGKRAPVVVGIHHGGASRADELSPWRLDDAQGGLGDVLLDWIAGPLTRWLGSRLRIASGPANTLIGGSSLGGLMALYAIARRPDVFGSVLCMSPALWVADGAIFRVMASARLPQDCRIYLDAGRHEGGTLDIAHEMARLLLYKGLVPMRQLAWRADRRGGHNERAWRRRLPRALRFFYDRSTSTGGRAWLWDGW